jgi:hypothetical protein
MGARPSGARRFSSPGVGPRPVTPPVEMIKERVIAGMHTPFPQQSTLSFVISTGAKRSGEISVLTISPGNNLGETS